MSAHPCFLWGGSSGTCCIILISATLKVELKKEFFIERNFKEFAGSIGIGFIIFWH
jgi:hypothetical protein